ncbi:hypothetical protein [Cupriavidus basilensis]|uniref:hypothetical protein n=1 Tax=Cupriavidus basilensis TaxID=68895 RepID=UPI0020A6B391|nr:hypothetical protein [Cupriavidus basilensis]MCP3017975.1 hypothetical protein [Cupriavidus basilensis]
MAKPAKTAKSNAASAAGELTGEVVLMRSALWMNGRRAVAAIITGIEEAEFGLAGAVAIVSATAFPPGAPSRMMRDVPLFEKEPAAEVIPAAWFKA